MSLPAIRALKDSNPEQKLIVITKSHLKSVYENIEEIDKIITIPSGKGIMNFILTVSTLKKWRIREGILFTNSFNSAISLRLAGVKDLTGYIRDMRGWLLKRKKKFPGKSIHQIKSYSDLVSLYIGSSIKGSFSNRLVFSPEEESRAQEILDENGSVVGERLIGISPAAAYGSSKEWPEYNFIDLINRLSEDIRNSGFIIFGSKNDENKVKKISDSVSAPLITIAGKYTLREAISVISKCDVFIGNDSGLLHTADAAGIPSIGIFGPTSPETTSPPGELTETIYKSAECSPCSYRECPIDHKCMNGISVEEIHNKIVKIIEPR